MDGVFLGFGCHGWVIPKPGLALLREIVPRLGLTCTTFVSCASFAR